MARSPVEDVEDSYEAAAKGHVDDLRSTRLPPEDVSSNVAEDLRRARKAGQLAGVSPAYDNRPSDSVIKKFGSKQRNAIASWIRERVREMEPDRETITDEYGFDLVARLDDIRLLIEFR